MSVAEKTRHIEVSFGKTHPKLFLVPLDKAHSIQKLIENYRYEPEEEEYIDIDEALKFAEKDRGEAGVLLAGYRKRDRLTQAQLAEKLDTHQSAAMESGKRAIGKALAKKMAEIFDTDYRNFL
jgi:DNA-binding XRE family transcriptional regulator